MSDPYDTDAGGYTLVRFTRAVQTHESGKKWWEDSVPPEALYPSLLEAIFAAREHLQTRSRADQAFYVDWVGIIAHAVVGSEETGWAVGWVGSDGIFYEGDYDNDERLHEQLVQYECWGVIRDFGYSGIALKSVWLDKDEARAEVVRLCGDDWDPEAPMEMEFKVFPYPLNRSDERSA